MARSRVEWGSDEGTPPAVEVLGAWDYEPGDVVSVSVTFAKAAGFEQAPLTEDHLVLAIMLPVGDKWLDGSSACTCSTPAVMRQQLHPTDGLYGQGGVVSTNWTATFGGMSLVLALVNCDRTPLIASVLSTLHWVVIWPLLPSL